MADVDVTVPLETSAWLEASRSTRKVRLPDCAVLDVVAVAIVASDDVPREACQPVSARRFCPASFNASMRLLRL